MQSWLYQLIRYNIPFIKKDIWIIQSKGISRLEKKNENTLFTLLQQLKNTWHVADSRHISPMNQLIRIEHRDPETHVNKQAVYNVRGGGSPARQSRFLPRQLRVWLSRGRMPLSDMMWQKWYPFPLFCPLLPPSLPRPCLPRDLSRASPAPSPAQVTNEKEIPSSGAGEVRRTTPKA